MCFYLDYNLLIVDLQNFTQMVQILHDGFQNMYIHLYYYSGEFLLYANTI